MSIPTRDLKVGDRVVVDRLARDFAATVASVEPTGSLVMGSTDRRIMAVRFSDAPKVIKCIEAAEDAPWTLEVTD